MTSLPSKNRRMVEAPFEIGEDEVVALDVDISNWPAAGGAISAIADALYDEDDNDLSSTHLIGSASDQGGDVIRGRQLTGLTRNQTYRYELMWDQGGNTWEAWGEVHCTR